MGLEGYRQARAPSPPPLLVQEVKWEQRLGTVALAGLRRPPVAVHILTHLQAPLSQQQQLEKGQSRHCLKKGFGGGRMGTCTLESLIFIPSSTGKTHSFLLQAFTSTAFCCCLCQQRINDIKTGHIQAFPWWW